MGTNIEWTDETWNPLVGCSRISEGCDHCYAVGVVHRQMSPQHVGLTVKPEGAPVDWTGEVRLVEHKFYEPLRWRRPRRVFVNSLSDLFEASVPDETIARIFAVMALAPQHTFQVLTKRPKRMADLLGDSAFAVGLAARYHDLGRRLHRGTDQMVWPLPNVQLGTSIELDKYAFRADHLRRTPAAVRFVSAEPLLGPLPSLDLTGIDWLIVGGESGPGARPMHPDWVRDLRDQCLGRSRFGDLYRSDIIPLTGHQIGADPVAFFFKQWGEWLGFDPDRYGDSITLAATTSALHKDWPGDRMSASVKVGKKAAGRELDGRTWDEFPGVL